ncbi:cytochrome P450 21 [Stachybotrys elegans]|uniref:Cytochrome P450 21 n=1 Tax=Stachybotrys elegans TaxID=80388 RepID=A0A8K0WIU1_9HYPO|nr:cytochrome P450 21 [Stachybotrys elegans]
MFTSSTWMGAALVASVCIAIGKVAQYLLSTLRPKLYPPGPPIRIGFGNLHQVPLNLSFLQFQKWASTYGEIMGLKMGPANVVVLSHPRPVHELFSKRGAIYSGRRFGYIAVEHVFKEHGDKHILNLQPGPFLRKWRKTSVRYFGSAVEKATVPMQEATAASLARKLLQTTPEESLDHIKYWAIATPLLAITGQSLEKRGVAFMHRLYAAQGDWLRMLDPGTTPPVDVIPILRLVPERFAHWKTLAKGVHKYMMDEYPVTLRASKELRAAAIGDGASGKYQGVVAKLLEENEPGKKPDYRMSDDEMAWTGGALLDAAVDTTYSSAMSSVLFMAAYPDIQDKCFAELRRLDLEKPPTTDDIDALPYLRAFLLEIRRFRPAAPLGLPHTLEADDVFEGYMIPKGTVVLTNIYAMHHDPAAYDRPNEFIPERYIDHPLGLKSDDENFPGRQATYAFGYGRRMCPGSEFAHTSALLALAKMLWAYKIVAQEPLDTSFETGYHHGLVPSPNPFKVSFELRDETKREAVIRDQETWASVLSSMGM